MPIDHQRQVSTAFGRDPPHMPRYRGWRVQAFPSHHLSAPGQIGVLAKSKEVLIEEFVFHRNRLDEIAPKHRSRSGRTENVLHAIKLSPVRLLGPAVEM